MNWLERARREIPKSARRRTANSAERTLTAVMAVPSLPVQTLSRGDFLFPDADEKYVPAVLAYIHDTEVETLNTQIENVLWVQVLHFASESTAAK